MGDNELSNALSSLAAWVFGVLRFFGSPRFLWWGAAESKAVATMPRVFLEDDRCLLHQSGLVHLGDGGTK